MLIRAQEMARYVSDGVLDAGLTGLRTGSPSTRRATAAPASLDAARRSDLREAELRQGALGARGAGGLARIQSPQDLEGKTIATELVRATQAYFERQRRATSTSSSRGAPPR